MLLLKCLMFYVNYIQIVLLYLHIKRKICVCLMKSVGMAGSGISTARHSTHTNMFRCVLTLALILQKTFHKV